MRCSLWYSVFFAVLITQNLLLFIVNPVMASLLSQQELVQRIQHTLQLHKQGRVEEAMQGYELVLPLLAGGLTKLSLLGNAGALCMSQGQNDKAFEYFSEAVQIAPENSQTQFNLAVVLTSKLNQHAKALKHCALAIRYDSSNHKAFHLMGNIMQILGKPKDAEKYFTIAESLAGTSSNDDSGNDSSANKDTSKNSKSSR